MRFDAVRPPLRPAFASRYVVCVAVCLVGFALGCSDNDDAAPRDGGLATDAGNDATDAGSDAATSRDGSSEADAGAPVDAGSSALEPCGDVTSDGRCASISRVELCVVQTGDTQPGHLGGYDCKDTEVCDDSSGRAQCTLVSECSEGDTECDGTALKSCVSGVWSSAECPTRCVASTLGAQCAADVPTQAMTGKVQYQARTPNTALTNWSALKLFPARQFAVLSYANGTLIDASTTDDTGAFALLGPATPSSADTLVVVAAGIDARGKLAFGVADAGYPSSLSAMREPFDKGPDVSLWSWSVTLDNFSSGATITIDDASGSGAARVFEAVQSIFADMQALYAPVTTPSVMVWTSPGTLWNCGACMASLPVVVAGSTFMHQVWLDGSSDNQGYWSDAVSEHELGHYVMSAYSYPPAEGGPHYTGTPTNPGLAWSEGFATFFSSYHRDSNLYYDKQSGTFFWLDLDARDYGIDSLSWTRPTKALGLEQLIDENEVAAMLRDTALSLGDATPMLTALASDRMRVAPFERGYTLRTWSDINAPEDYEETTQSIPYLADFFDALRCEDAISAAALNLVTEPATHYPYPSESPLCR